MQHDGALAVPAADGVHERRAERGERPAVQHRVAAAGGLRDGAVQEVDAGLDGAGGDRGAAGLEPAGGGGPAADRHRGPVLRRCRRGPQGGGGGHAELVAQQRLAEHHLPRRARGVPGGGEAAHQQLVVGLVERVQRDGPPRVPDGGRGVPLDEQGDGGLSRARLQPGAGAVPLDDEPRLERGAAGDDETLEQLGAQAEQPCGVDVRPVEQADVERGPGGQPRVDGVAAQHGGVAEGAAQLRERPADGAERVGGVGEQQLGELRAGHRPLAEHDVGEQRPRLTTAGRRRGAARVAVDPGRAEQPDRRRHRAPPRPVWPAGRRRSRDGRPRPQRPVLSTALSTTVSTTDSTTETTTIARQPRAPPTGRTRRGLMVVPVPGRCPAMRGRWVCAGREVRLRDRRSGRTTT